MTNSLKLSLSIFLLICFGIFACGRIRVQTHSTQLGHFDRYYTFNFHEFETGDGESQRFNKRAHEKLVNEIKEEMVKRNYTLANTPDLTISIYVQVKDNVRSEGVYDIQPGIYDYQNPDYKNSPFFGNYFGYNYGANIPATTFSNEVGSLIIDIVDTKENQLVWQGMARKLFWSDNPENLEKLIQKGVSDIFKNYPYQAPNSISQNNQ